MIQLSEDQHIKTSKLILNKNAQQFKNNLDEEIRKALFNDQPEGALMQSMNATAGARYECIYKNLLRDMRQFYSDKF